MSDLEPSWRDEAAWPAVDVVMPIRDEADHLAEAVAAVRAQDYPGDVRVVIGVGPSTDDTLAVATHLAAADPLVTVVDNPTGATAAALNIAIRAGTAPIVVRVDGRSVLSDGYVRRAVETMRRTGAVNVGGLQRPVGSTAFQRAVAAATTSWLGTGGASYRTGGAPRSVDTVYLGVFDRAAIEAVGLFDERLVRNQDYELNIRLRRAGGTVWFDPELSADYVPRGSWRSLSKQYYEYGVWKAHVMRLHPEATRLRQVAPLALAAANLAALALSWRHRRLLIVPAAYAAALVVLAPSCDAPSSTATSRAEPNPDTPVRRRLRVAAVLAVIHHVWPAGVVAGSLRRAGPSR